MFKRSTLILGLIVLFSFNSFAQNESEKDSTKSIVLNVKAGAIGAVDNEVPFWMLWNNSARIDKDYANGLYQDVHLKSTNQLFTNLILDWEVESVFSQSPNGIFGSLIQANIGASTNFLQLRAGMEEEFFGFNDRDLSVGNIVYSNNARPIPKVSISTNGWQKLPVIGKHFSFQAYLAHGWFEKNRYQSNAFLHQKYFYLKSSFFKDKLSLEGGVNHMAQWAGSNQSTESVQPSGFKNFGRIFMGSSGDESATISDQINALGNHLGSYDFNLSYNFKSLQFQAYTQFLFEDSSGLKPIKWDDGLYGISISSANFKWINKLVIEYWDTTDQDVTADNLLNGFPANNYMNNGTYRSGWTYENRVIGNPMFILLNPDIDSNGRIKNMLTGWNFGIQGGFGQISYQLKYTEFKNTGRSREVLEPSLKMHSVDGKLNYIMPNELEIGLWMNYQKDNFDQGENFGMFLTLAKNLRLK